MRSTLAIATVLICSPILLAQTGTFTIYGTGCGGGGGSACVTSNTTGNFAGNAGGTVNFAILANSGNAVRIICGIELYCKLRGSSSANMNVWIYDATTAGKPGTLQRTTTMPMTNTLKWHKATFTPLIILPNKAFFIVIDNRVSLNLPLMTTGTNVTHYHSGPPTWRGPYTSVRWNYKVICCGSGTVPLLSNSGVPTIGQSFSVNLSSAAASSTALFTVGVGRTNIDMAIIGAPGCRLYTNPLLILSMTTGTTGTASLNITIPNDSTLVGTPFNTQWAVIQPGVNPAGILFTAGGEGKVGK